MRRVTPNLVGVFVGNASDPAPLRRTTSGVTGGDNSISRGGVLGRIVSVAMAPWERGSGVAGLEVGADSE